MGSLALGSWDSDLGLGSEAGGTRLLRLEEPAGWAVVAGWLAGRLARRTAGHRRTPSPGSPYKSWLGVPESKAKEIE